MNPLTKTLLCLITTILPSAYATSVILGDSSSEPRGLDVIDIQSYRDDPSEVAGGDYSAAIGLGNLASGVESASLGLYNYTLGFQSISFGFGNLVESGSAYAFGTVNTIHGSSSQSSDGLGVFGFNNVINTGGVGSFIFGRNNTVNSANSTVFGAGITNASAGSTMIGPSNAAKVTILSSGNVGIGTGDSAPTEKLHVVGNLKVTGSIISPIIAGSGSGSTSRLLVGGTTSPASSWQGTTVVGADGQNKVITGYLGSSTSGAVIGAHNSALTAWADLNIAGSNLIFRTNETERMRISNSGFLGIGINNPSAPLHINHTSSGVVGSVIIQNLSQFGTASYAIRDYSGQSVGSLAYTNNTPLIASGALALSAHTSTASILLNTGTGLSPRLAVTSSGNVGIGTTTPAAKLDVSGAIQVAGNLTIKNVGTTKSVIRISPAGDIDMGGFTSGTNPN